MNNFGRNLALWVIVALLLVALFNLFQPSGGGRAGAQQVAYSDFLNDVNAGHVREVSIQGRSLSGTLSDGRTFQTYTPEDPALVSRLTEKNVRVVARPEDSDVNPLLHYLDIVRAPLLGADQELRHWVVVLVLTVVGWGFAALAMRQYRARVAYWV